MKSSIIDVPSLCEQERIVFRIEELFSELDKAVETLQTTKRQLAVYRQAVLKEAFEGQLTREWRKVNDVKSAADFLAEIQSFSKTVGYCAPMEEIVLSSLPSEWKWVSIGDISMGAKYGTSKKSDENGIVPVIRMGNIQNGVILWDDLVFSNDELEIKEYNLVIGDVLFIGKIKQVSNYPCKTGHFPAFLLD